MTIPCEKLTGFLTQVLVQHLTDVVNDLPASVALYRPLCWTPSGGDEEYSRELELNCFESAEFRVSMDALLEAFDVYVASPGYNPAANPQVVVRFSLLCLEYCKWRLSGSDLTVWQAFF